jgi:hypothetical protein
MCSRIGYLLASALTLVFLCNVTHAEANRKIAVTERNVPTDERQNYFEELESFALDTIVEFLKGLKLSTTQIESELRNIDLKIIKDDNCLSSSTLSGISQALRRGCATSEGDEFISSIILPQFVEKRRVKNNFYPYGLKRLRATPSPSDNVIEYEEQYAVAGAERTLTETLIVLGFLNLYWDQIKDKPTITDTERHIVYFGFGKYSVALGPLCGQLSGSSKARCQNVEREAADIPRAAAKKK